MKAFLSNVWKGEGGTPREGRANTSPTQPGLAGQGWPTVMPLTTGAAMVVATGDLSDGESSDGGGGAVDAFATRQPSQQTATFAPPPPQPVIPQQQQQQQQPLRPGSKPSTPLAQAPVVMAPTTAAMASLNNSHHSSGAAIHYKSNNGRIEELSDDEEEDVPPVDPHRRQQMMAAFESSTIGDDASDDVKIQRRKKQEMWLRQQQQRGMLLSGPGASHPKAFVVRSMSRPNTPVQTPALLGAPPPPSPTRPKVTSSPASSSEDSFHHRKPADATSATLPPPVAMSASRTMKGPTSTAMSDRSGPTTKAARRSNSPTQRGPILSNSNGPLRATGAAAGVPVQQPPPRVQSPVRQAPLPDHPPPQRSSSANYINRPGGASATGYPRYPSTGGASAAAIAMDQRAGGQPPVQAPQRLPSRQPAPVDARYVDPLEEAAALCYRGSSVPSSNYGDDDGGGRTGALVTRTSSGLCIPAGRLIVAVGRPQTGKSSFVNAFRAVNVGDANTVPWTEAAVGRCGRHGTVTVEAYPSALPPRRPLWTVIDTPGLLYEHMIASDDATDAAEKSSSSSGRVSEAGWFDRVFLTALMRVGLPYGLHVSTASGKAAVHKVREAAKKNAAPTATSTSTNSTDSTNTPATTSSATSSGTNSADILSLAFQMPSIPGPTSSAFFPVPNVSPSRAAAVAAAQQTAFDYALPPPCPENIAEQMIVIVRASDLITPVTALQRLVTSFGLGPLGRSNPNSAASGPPLPGNRFCRAATSKSVVNGLQDIFDVGRDAMGDRSPFLVVTHMDTVVACRSVDITVDPRAELYDPHEMTAARQALFDVLKDCIPTNRIFFLALPTATQEQREAQRLQAERQAKSAMVLSNDIFALGKLSSTESKSTNGFLKLATAGGGIIPLSSSEGTRPSTTATSPALGVAGKLAAAASAASAAAMTFKAPPATIMSGMLLDGSTRHQLVALHEALVADIAMRRSQRSGALGVTTAMM